MRIVAGAITTLRRIVDLTLIALIGVVLFGLILGKIVPLTGHQTIIIGGGSMEPTIGLGAAVVITPVQPADLNTGDVVSLLVGPNRATFTHRVVDIVTRPDGLWVRTKGDANADPDPTLVPATAVVGRVDWWIPWAGFLLAFLSLPVGVIFVLGLGATLVAITWLLESLEGDPEPAMVGVASDASSGEPIATRPRLLRPSLSAPLAGGASIAAFGAAPRPTVPEQLARSRANRVRRNHWLAARPPRGMKAD
jgi:signal peptidase I